MLISTQFEGALVNTNESVNFSGHVVITVPKQLKITGWFMAFQDAFGALAKDKELWGQPQAIKLLNE